MTTKEMQKLKDAILHIWTADTYAAAFVVD